MEYIVKITKATDTSIVKKYCIVDGNENLIRVLQYDKPNLCIEFVSDVEELPEFLKYQNF